MVIILKTLDLSNLFPSNLPEEFFSAQPITANLNFMNMFLFVPVGVVGYISIKTNYQYQIVLVLDKDYSI